jgi:molybdopterin-guanine dinucleotide biosynthesis adapter protein
MKIIAVVGSKKTGKTILVTKIVKELVKRGFSVATVKHSHHNFDLEGKDTWLHNKAGSEFVIGSSKDETFFIIKEGMELDNILSMVKFLKKVDYIVIEGFKHSKYAKISTSDFNDEYTFANINPMEMDESDVIFIVDQIENRSFGILKNFNCKMCGFKSCEEFIRAKVSDKAPEVECNTDTDNILLRIDDLEIPLNPFVQSFVKNTIIGMINSLKTDQFGAIKGKKVELLIRNDTNR